MDRECGRMALVGGWALRGEVDVCLSVYLSLLRVCVYGPRLCVPCRWLVCLSVDTKEKWKAASPSKRVLRSDNIDTSINAFHARQSVCLLQKRMDSVRIMIMSREAAELAVCIAYATPGLLSSPIHPTDQCRRSTCRHHRWPYTMSARMSR